MKKWLVAIGLVMVLAMPALAQVWGDFGYSVSGGQATITNYTGAGGPVVIPADIEGNPVVTIGQAAFHGHASITSVAIPGSVTVISTNAFLWCSGLTSLVIPDSVREIHLDAFLYCGGLTNVHFGSGLTNIGFGAFSQCTSLTRVTIPGTVTRVDNQAFAVGRSLTQVTIQNGVQYLHRNAFQNCTNLPSLFIPASVTDMSSGSAFYQCYRLTNLTVDAANTAFSSVDGVLFNKAQTVLIRYPSARTQTSYAIPPGVQRLDTGSFMYASQLTEVDIPDGVTEIWSSAFGSCNGLRDITLPDSVTEIGSWVFSFCPALVNVIIGSGAETLGVQVFWGCGALRGAHFAGDAPAIGDGIFSNSTPTVYYRAGTTGWGDTLAGRPTALWTSYPDPMHQAWDSGYEDIGSGWRRLNWFGDYAPMALEGWIWHNKHGFFYVANTSTPENVWLFANDMGWLYTGNGTYPFLYRANDGKWLWYNGAVSPRWFVDMGTGQWESWNP